METKIIGEKTDIQEIPEGTSRFQYIVGEGGNLTLLLLALGRVKSSVEATVRLAGKGASATIVGIILGKNNASLAIHTLQQHEVPETTSNLLVKTVLADGATCVYDGGIRVEKRAQKTDAYQRNENLLLSADAHAESKPRLEILADDVRCTHGATVGHIPEDQLWYLATRGIPSGKGQDLIVSGFLKSALDIVTDENVRNELDTFVSRAV
ncbi:SufD family Fe-S cluster assembly protein [Candidatus Gottesmanbacteria bacterium]|nr:SufD family Fe-S cluster assembly protein [Candidatus Gottesmanbacteria bacterium]